MPNCWPSLKENCADYHVRFRRVRGPNLLSTIDRLRKQHTFYWNYPEIRHKFEIIKDSKTPVFHKMAENQEQECQLRRRRLSGNPNLSLHLDGGSEITEGNPDEGTPSPSKPFPGSSKRPSQAQLLAFKNKQQSFDLHIIQVEECEEVEIVVDSDDDTDENVASGIQRAVTPTPIQDFAANTVYTEGPQVSDFLRVKALENDCYTDVSDADTTDEE